MHECGWFCTTYLGLGNGIKLLGLAKPGDIADALAKATAEIPQLALVRLSLVGSAVLVEPFGDGGPRGVETAKAMTAIPSIAPSSGAACHARAMLAIRLQLKRVTDDADAMATAFDRLDAEAKPDLDCAAKDPALAERIAKLREALAGMRQLPPRASRP